MQNQERPQSIPVTRFFLRNKKFGTKWRNSDKKSNSLKHEKKKFVYMIGWMRVGFFSFSLKLKPRLKTILRPRLKHMIYSHKFGLNSKFFEHKTTAQMSK